MRTHSILIAVATLVAAVVSGCDNSRDLLSPDARSSGVIIVKQPPQTCADLLASRTLICQWNANADVSAGEQVTCSLRFNGAAFCWGSNANDELGNGSSLSVSTSTPVAVAGGRFYSSISVGFTHACAIERGTGAAFCWGTNDAGQVGVDRNAVPLASTPAAVSGGHVFTAISAGHGLTCGVSNGAVLCWGTGIGSTPTQRADLSGTFTGVSAGSDWAWSSTDVCALATDGTACVAHGGPSIATIGQGGTADHFCLIDASAITKCWGENYYGQLGDSTAGASNYANALETSPVVVKGFHAFQSIATGGQNTCALSSGAAFCWGWNYYQQLGTGGGQVYSSMPQAVSMPAGTTFTKIAVGDGHACAIDPAGGVWCWGRDDFGQGAPNSGTPVRVVQQPIP